MGFLRTPAVVLKSRKWGDGDRIVTFFTLHHGKLRGVARGARKPKARFGSALEPFVYGELYVFEKGNDPLCRVTQVDIVESNAVLREDLARMAAAGRLVNLVEAVTGEGDAGPKTFNTLVTGLRALGESSDVLLPALLFQIRLLALAGFRPQTTHCAVCARKDRQEYGHFSAVAGGLICVDCAGRRPNHCLPMSRGAIVFMDQAVSLPEDVLRRLKATGQVRDEVERAIEAYVSVVAGRHLPPANFLVAEPQVTAYRLPE
jgi:DNA repair protein RecO (recombination protein O)